MEARVHDIAKSPSVPHKKQTTYKILVIGDPGTGKYYLSENAYLVKMPKVVVLIIA